MTRPTWLRRGLLLAAQILFTLAFLGLWQWSVSSGLVDGYFISQPSAILAALERWFADGSIWKHITSTLIILLAGYSLGTFAGIVIGVCIGVSKTFAEIVEPFLIFLNATPRLILLPFFVIWLGFGPEPKILLVVFVIVFVVAVNIAAGIREVSGELLSNVRMLGGNRSQLIRQVYLPAIGLWIISTARTTVGYAFQATVTSEFLGSATGLGYLVVAGQSNLKVEEIFAALAVIVALSWGIDAMLHLVERRMTRWMPA